MKLLFQGRLRGAFYGLLFLGAMGSSGAAWGRSSVLEPERLAPLVRTALVLGLPPGIRVRSVVVPVGVYAERGFPEVVVRELKQWPIGQRLAEGRADLFTGHGATRGGPFPFLFKATVEREAHTATKVPVIGRGAQVRIEVVSANIRLVSPGVAQEPASVGDRIQVLPQHGGKILSGTVVDAERVEVRL